MPTGWNEKTLRDDISVVFVKTKFHFDEKVRPIKLGTGLPIQGLLQKVNYKVNVHNSKNHPSQSQFLDLKNTSSASIFFERGSL